jgi:hypothetical protein
MAAIVIEIADAVTALLNEATLSQSFTAERSYVPVHELEDLVDTGILAVTVVPAGLTGNLIDRSPRSMYDYVIDVGIQKALPIGALTESQRNAFVDPLMLLAQEVVDLFNGAVLTIPYDTIRPRCVDVKNIPAFSPHHMDEEGVFTSLITLNFKLGR